MCLATEFLRIFTVRVRSTREGNIYTWECLSVHHGGGGYPIPGLSRGSTPFLVWGVPHPMSGWGGTPSQVWVGGVPCPRCGGYPIPGLDGGGTQGTPLARSGWWGVPHDWMGYSPHHDWMGYPTHTMTGWGTRPQ